MNYNHLILEPKESILYVTISRPKFLNALNREVFSELEEMITYSINNKEIKGIIITGSGDKAFVAGADIKEFMNFSKEQAMELAANGQRIFQLFEDSPKPIIAAVNGFALGGGCELAMACHLRVASVNASFAQPEVALGVTPGYAGTQRLVQLIGKTKALEFLISGEKFSAQTAKELGLVNYICEQEVLLTVATDLMKKILKNSTSAIAGVIRCVNSFYNKTLNGYHKEVEEFGKCFETVDFKEGTTAFVEKRKPDFRGW
jgi:enoyl-CoA hydratase